MIWDEVVAWGRLFLATPGSWSLRWLSWLGPDDRAAGAWAFWPAATAKLGGQRPTAGAAVSATRPTTSSPSRCAARW
jgi:hypothetical protein